MKNQMKILIAISSLDLERSASSRIIMKEFLFSIWFISLSSNLKLSIDIFIMSVSHVFADFRFIFVKRSCSRRDSTSLFSLFYKIILYIQGSRLRPFFWECASKNLKWSHFVSHTARVRAEAVQRQCVFRMGASARARRCAQRTERNGGFGFQTKVKDCFLKQRRWTCWYSCRENMQVLSATDSLVWLFVFVLKSLLSLLFTSRGMEAFLIFLYYYYLIPQCLLNILLCISRYNTACDVSYASSYSFLLINVMLVCHCNILFYCCCAF